VNAVWVYQHDNLVLFLVLRHQPGSNVNIGRPTVALSLQVCKQSGGNGLLSSAASSIAGKPSNVFRGRPAKLGVVKKPGVGRPARGGHRSLARAGILAVDSDRTKCTVSLECIATSKQSDTLSQVTTSSDQLTRLSLLTQSARDSSSKEFSLSSVISSSAPALASVAVGRLYSSPVSTPGDEPPQVLSAVAIISQPLDQTRMTSSPNNSDTPPPTLDVCSNAVPSATLLHDSRQALTQASLLERLIKDSVSHENESQHYVNSKSAVVKLTETLLVTKASDLSEAESQPHVILNAKLMTPPSLSSAVMYSARTGTAVNVLTNVLTLSTSKTKKSSCSQKFVLCKGWCHNNSFL